MFVCLVCECRISVKDVSLTSLAEQVQQSWNAFLNYLETSVVLIEIEIVSFC
jgi:hypothetical protein